MSTSTPVLVSLLPGNVRLLFDLGGTQLRMWLYDGEVLVISLSRDRPKDLTPAMLVGMLYGWIEAVLAQYCLRPEQLTAIGGSIAGPVENGIVGETPNIWADMFVDLTTMLRQAFGVERVLILNDCLAALIGEHTYGAGVGFDDLFYITWSTGIGGTGMVHGVVISGCEPGHFVIDLSDTTPQCGCGVHGHLEAMASGTAMSKFANHFVVRRPAGEFAQYLAELGAESLTAEDVCNLARRGKAIAPGAHQLIELVGSAFGVGLATIISILRPKRIIIGGGLTKSWDLFELYVRASMQEVLMRSIVPADNLIQLAALPGESALYGLLAELMAPTLP